MHSFMEVISIVLLVLFLLVFIVNWIQFIGSVIIKEKCGSAIPFVGGIIGMIGILLFPKEGIWKYAWIPFVIDWGSIPIIVYSMLFPYFHPEYYEINAASHDRDKEVRPDGSNNEQNNE